MPCFSAGNFLVSKSWNTHTQTHTHLLKNSSIVLLPVKSHGPRSLVGCSPWGPEESGTIEWLHFHFSLSCIGEGNGNPLQCSCWRIPGTGEPDGLKSMGSHKVRHDWRDLAAAETLIWISITWLHTLVEYLPASAGDVGLIARSGRYPGERTGNSLQYSCLDNPMWSQKSRTQQ